MAGHSDAELPPPHSWGVWATPVTICRFVHALHRTQRVVLLSDNVRPQPIRVLMALKVAKVASKVGLMACFYHRATQSVRPGAGDEFMECQKGTVKGLSFNWQRVSRRSLMKRFTR